MRFESTFDCAVVAGVYLRPRACVKFVPAIRLGPRFCCSSFFSFLVKNVNPMQIFNGGSTWVIDCPLRLQYRLQTLYLIGSICLFLQRACVFFLCETKPFRNQFNDLNSMHYYNPSFSVRISLWRGCQLLLDYKRVACKQ